MRQYYASDKKKREEAKRKQKEEKRLKRLNKSSKNSAEAGTEPGSTATDAEPEVSTQAPKP